MRDIVENIAAQAHRLYHLGVVRLSRSNLSRINEGKPFSLYEALFGKLLRRCQAMAPEHIFRFKKCVMKRKIYATRDEAKTEIFNFIEISYNPVKRHSHTGGVSPVKFEEDYFSRL